MQKIIFLLFAAIFTATIAYAENNNPTELTVGIIPRHNYTETIRMYLPLINYLNETLSIKVKLETSRKYSEFWKKIVNQEFDIVHYNQYHYLVSHEKYKYNVILKNQENNSDTISSLIIVLKDSGINSILDLKNKNIIFGGSEMAMMSYLVPKKLLYNAGLKELDYHTSFALNPPNALLAVLIGQADACGVGDPIPQLVKIKNKIDISNIKILSQSDRYPHLAWAVHQSMSDKLKKEIIMVLLKLNDSNRGLKILKRASLTGIVSATDQDYKIMMKYLMD